MVCVGEGEVVLVCVDRDNYHYVTIILSLGHILRVL
jgi:hypothetical protein